jgi:hypothetical protein
MILLLREEKTNEGSLFSLLPGTSWFWEAYW